MIRKILKSIFSNRDEKIPETDNPLILVEYINKISNDLGKYAFEENIRIKAKKAKDVLPILDEIENRCLSLKNSDLFYAIAVAYHNYCKGFVRGEERQQYLNKIVYFLKKSISLSPDNCNSIVLLGALLIEQKLVRDLPEGIRLLENAKRNGNMPTYLNSTLAKARRQSGNINLKKLSLCEFKKDPSPAVFREERKRIRAFIQKYKKENNSEKLKTVLNHYYNLAVMVTLCYVEHDCNSAVIGWQYDDAIKIIKDTCSKIDCSFTTHGYLIKSNYISKNDWKTFVTVFGETKLQFKPFDEYNVTHREDPYASL